ncbi:transposable element Tcb1 transposase [Trichonephila clavipes]|nr:transposable element Tcb1 transposase [Trichonephila clavipes]
MAVGSLVVRASDSRPEGLGSMLDVTKYPPSAHGFTCRNCGGGDRGRVAIYRPFGEVSLSLNRTVTCMVLKANDRRTSCPCHDEFRGPRSDYVRQIGLSARRPWLDLSLTQNHRRLHRQWCAKRRMWAAEWNEVVFTDESHIFLQHHDGRIRVWRHRRERMLNSCVMPRHTGPAPGIMITLLPWTIRSPDLSPIENMWPMVSQLLTQITSLAATPDRLWQRVEAAWSAVPQERIESLFESMLRRVAVVISNNGGYSGY